MTLVIHRGGKPINIYSQPLKDKIQNHIDKWESCAGCPLSSQRRRVVIYRGEVPCQVLFISESPTDRDDSLGSPMSGPAGDLMDEMITSASHRSSLSQPISYGFTSMVSCYPKTVTTDKGSGKTRRPTPTEVQSCSSRLLELWGILNPYLIVWVGTIAKSRIPKIIQQRHTGDRSLTLPHPHSILKHAENPGVYDLNRKKWVINLSDHLALCNRSTDLTNPWGEE